MTLLLLPGLGSDGALWAAQVRDFADVADCQVGDTLQDDSLPAMAGRILAAAPPRFALAGLSMGGHLAFEMGTGHLTAMEQPDAVTAAMRERLSR